MRTRRLRALQGRWVADVANAAKHGVSGPCDVLQVAQGYLVVDHNNDRLVLAPADGGPTVQLGKKGTALGEFMKPSAVALVRDGARVQVRHNHVGVTVLFANAPLGSVGRLGGVCVWWWWGGGGGWLVARQGQMRCGLVLPWVAFKPSTYSRSVPQPPTRPWAGACSRGAPKGPIHRVLAV